MAETSLSYKKKDRKSSADSSEGDCHSPEDKKIKFGPGGEAEFDEVQSVFEMAEDLPPKLNAVLSKLNDMEKKLEKLDHLESYVKSLEGKIKEINTKVDRFETTRVLVNEIDKGMAFLNSEVESLKQTLEGQKEEMDTLRQENLYMGVYQRRENLRFHGIPEKKDEDNTQEVLVNFMKAELGIEDADKIEFQRVHRIGKPRSNSSGKPRQIIARFLRYSDRERVMDRATRLRGKKIGISPDFPKEIVERRKKLMPKLTAAKKAGKRASFSRPEPDKLYVEGILVDI